MLLPPLSQAVSELALGRDGWLMAIAFCSLGTGTLFLAAMLRRLDAPPRVAPYLIAASGFLSYVSAFVHADGPHGSTTHGQIHQTVGIATFVLMISGMFALVRPFRLDQHNGGSGRRHVTETPASTQRQCLSCYLSPSSSLVGRAWAAAMRSGGVGWLNQAR